MKTHFFVATSIAGLMLSAPAGAVTASSCPGLTGILPQAKYKEIFFPDFSSATFNTRRKDCTAAKQGADCSLYYDSSNLNAALGSADLNINYPNMPEIACNVKLRDRKRIVAEFFAHVAQETNAANPTGDGNPANATMGLAWGLSQVSEGPCYANEAKWTDVCEYNISESLKRSYYGRGPLQLSYTSNYKWAQTVLNKHDSTRWSFDFVTEPNLLLSNPTLGWAASLVYQAADYKTDDMQTARPSLTKGMIKAQWVDTEKYGKSTEYGTYGFGQTINIMNPIECSPNDPNNQQAPDRVRVTSLNRINNYLEMLIRLGVNDLEKVTVEYVDTATASTEYTLAQMKSNVNMENPVFYTWAGGKEQRYVTTPLPIDLYSENSRSVIDPSNGGVIPFTGIKGIVATYSDGVTERLDCTGYKSLQ